MNDCARPTLRYKAQIRLNQYDTVIFKQEQHVNDKPNIKGEIKAFLIVLCPSIEKHGHAVQLCFYLNLLKKYQKDLNISQY